MSDKEVYGQRYSTDTLRIGHVVRDLTSMAMELHSSGCDVVKVEALQLMVDSFMKKWTELAERSYTRPTEGNDV